MPRGNKWVGSLRSATGARVEPAVAWYEGLQPKVAVFPNGPEQVAEVLSFASKEGLAVIPMGGGTFSHLGNRPAGADIVLSTAFLKGGLEHSPEDLVATVPAGFTIDEANSTIGRRAQILPLDSPNPEKATIGGAIAVDGIGPRTQGFGRVRHSILGMRVVLPDGSVTKTGGKVVKNVAGYDLAKLYVGSLGTLGVITEATFKLRPNPPTLVTLLFSFPTLDGAVRASCDLLENGLDPTSLSVVDGKLMPSLSIKEPLPHILVEFGDFQEVVRREARDAKAIVGRRGGTEIPVPKAGASRDLWQSVAALPVKEGVATIRGSVPPAEVEKFAMAGLESLLSHGGSWTAVIHPGLGTVYFIGLNTGRESLVNAIHELWALSSSLGGIAIVERAPLSTKEGIDVWGPSPKHIELLRQLKREFDPTGILNPGRFVGGI